MHYDAFDVVERPTLVTGDSKQERAARELERFVRYADGLAQGEEKPQSLRAWLDLAEAWRITQALRECKGNRSAAARLLGIGRRTLYAKMDKLDIVPRWNI